VLDIYIYIISIIIIIFIYIMISLATDRWQFCLLLLHGLVEQCARLLDLVLPRQKGQDMTLLCTHTQHHTRFSLTPVPSERPGYGPPLHPHTAQDTQPTEHVRGSRNTSGVCTGLPCRLDDSDIEEVANWIMKLPLFDNLSHPVSGGS
jgi:hypothetical protein